MVINSTHPLLYIFAVAFVASIGWTLGSAFIVAISNQILARIVQHGSSASAIEATARKEVTAPAGFAYVIRPGQS